MVADRVLMIVLLVVSCLLASGCVDSMQSIQAPGQNTSGHDNAPVPFVTQGGLTPAPGKDSAAARLAPDDRLLPPTPDTRLAHEPLVGRYGDWSRNVVQQQDQVSPESITGSSSGSSGSAPQPASAAVAGLVAPMPASGLGSFTEPARSTLPVPVAGGTGNPPGEYYEGAGAVITPFPTRDPNSCGCAM
jgi:hypothetical protein